MQKQIVPEGKTAVRSPSVAPIYGVGLCWVICAFVFPLYKLWAIVLTAALSVGAFFMLKRAFPGSVSYIDAPTGDRELDALIRDGRAQLARIREADVKIKDPVVSGKIVEIAALGDKIFDNLTPENKRSSGVRTFMNYFLPTVTKLLEHYAVLERQGVQGENIAVSMKSVEDSLDMVKGAFEKELDNMFSGTTLDITTDIEVLEQMLRREGLAGDEKVLESK